MITPRGDVQLQAPPVAGLQQPETGMPEALRADFALQYQQSYGLIFRHMLRSSHNWHTAEDLTQQTFTQALPRWDILAPQPERNRRNYLVRTATNLFINQYRQQKRRGITSPLEDYDETRQTQPSVDDLVTGYSSMIEGLRTVPDTFRNVVVLVDVCGYTYKDCADELGMPIGTVMSKLARGRTLLRQHYLEQGYVSKS